MCGRFTLVSSRYEIERVFAIDEVEVDDEDAAARYNVSPTQQVLIVTSFQDGKQRSLAKCRWGLVPSWAKDLSVGNRMINARIETAASKPAFRAAFARRRCLLPVSGYYEWQKFPSGSAGKVAKTPFYFHRRDGSLLAFAGLWEQWHGDSGPVRSCTILTTAADAVNEPVHDRMPLILRPEDWERWLAPGTIGPAELPALLSRAGDDGLVAHRVTTRVNSPRNQGPELIEAEPF